MAAIKRNIDIVLILAVGFLLRFTISFTHSYSNDELSAVSRLRYSNFSDLIEFGVQKGDMHPAGVQVFMKGWSLIFGKSELAMRFPFVIFGTAAIFVLFLIGKNWFNRKVGLLAAGLLAVLYFPILNSEFARPYSPGLLLALLVGYFFFKVLFESSHKVRNAILLGVFMSAGMYTHYFAFLFLGFIGFTGLFFLTKENWKAYLGACFLAVALFLPHLGITIYHLSVGGLQWLGPPDWDWLFHFLFHAFNESWLLIGAFVALIIFAFFYRQTSTPFPRRNIVLPFVWFFGIYAVGHVLSLVSTPVLKFPVLLFAFPYFLLLLAIIWSRIPKTGILLASVMLLGMSSTLIERDLYGNKHFALFKETGLKMAAWNQLYGKENIYTVYNLNNTDYINFYVDEWGGDSLDFDWSVLEYDSHYELRRVLQERTEEYCVVGYSCRNTLIQVYETVREFYPVIVDYEQFNNGAVFLMKKGGPETELGKKIELARFSTYARAGEWEFDAGQLQGFTDLDNAYAMDANNIYGPTFSFSMENLPAFENGYLKVEISADMDSSAGVTVSMGGKRDGEIIQDREENMWIGQNLEEMILSSENHTGYFATTIPYYILPTDTLKIGIWNRGGTPVTLKSVRIYYCENYWN